MGEMNAQRSAYLEEKRQFEIKIAALEQEIVTLQAAQTSKVNVDLAISTTESEQLQKQTALIVSPNFPAETAIDKSIQASLQEERDKLLSEKEAWSKAPATTSTSTPAPNNWEADKTQLIKDRDDALEKLKAATADIQKATNESRSVKFQNVSVSFIRQCQI